MRLETFFPYRLAVAAEAFSRSLVAVYGRAFGLSREEWRLLFLLAGGERLDSGELARRTTLDKVQVSRASQRLEAKGLITRAIADRDRRLREYEITVAGQALFTEVLPRVEAQADAVLGAMSATDREALDRGLGALMRAMEASAR